MTHTARHARRPARPRGGFTLVEILIAVSIIVLMIGLSLPAFRAITGSRSTEGATNNVTSLLGRARADAIGAQAPRGVAFYTDATGQCRMAEVGAVTFSEWFKTTSSPPVSPVPTISNLNTPYAKGAYVYYHIPGTITPPVYRYFVATQPVTANLNLDLSQSPLPAGVAVYWHEFADKTIEFALASAWNSTSPTLYDQLPDTDAIPLPLGVAAQVINDNTNTAVSQEHYLHNGVVMFDGNGRMALQPAVLSQYGQVGSAVGYDLANLYALKGTTLQTVQGSEAIASGLVGTAALSSSFGLVLYDREAAANQKFPPHDPTMDTTYTYPGSTTPSELDAENWLDANATPLLINRYTGTLVRGE